MKWQPINTAPRVSGKDYATQDWARDLGMNTPVLLWGKPFLNQTQELGSARCFVGFWSMRDRWEEAMQGMTDEALESYEIIPTHWMPLPLPPEARA